MYEGKSSFKVRRFAEGQTILSFENGILYLNKMKLKHHSSKRITFTVLDACYDEDAECPVFDEFLDTITEGREDLKERFMMALGYLLIEPSNGNISSLWGMLRTLARVSWAIPYRNFIRKLGEQPLAW